MSIRLHINGKERQVPEGASVMALLDLLELPALRVAVEHNHKVLKRDEFADTTLAEGDRIEVVQFVGGG